jgi:hypothetical protein
MLEDELRSNQANLTERAKIRDLIKKGQDALEQEKLQLKEKFDERVNLIL